MLGAVDDDENLLPSTDDWNTQLIGCGSNSFGQLNPASIHLMLPSFRSVQMPMKSKVKVESLDDTLRHVKLFTTGANCTVLVVSEADHLSDSSTVSDSVYVWGNNKYFLTSGSITMKCNIVEISCGQSHIGVVSSQGRVYTWGNNEFGYLGHENKTALTAPKAVKSLIGMTALGISCGAFHTAIIVREEHKSSSSDGNENFMTRQCGVLYVCGLGKTGQLGLEKLPNSGCVVKPTKLTFFAEQLVAKVSCGFHHTLVLVVSPSVSTGLTSKVFAFGYNEHGRLGINSEHKALTPVEIKFPAEFRPLHISAGEQHSLAAGATGGCFAWGCNSMGQLGVASPTVMPFSMIPASIPRLETLIVSRLVAGGRHSACLTSDGKLFTWGWGEEGQLGQGSEKSAYYPRTCPVSRFTDNVTILGMGLGMAHTVLLLQNENYVPPEPKPEPEPVVVEIVPVPLDVVVVEEPQLEEEEEEVPTVELSFVAEKVVVDPPAARAPPSIATDDEVSEPFPSPSPLPSLTDNFHRIMSPQPPQPVVSLSLPNIRREDTAIQGIKELLLQREMRKAKEPVLSLPDIAPVSPIKDAVINDRQLLETYLIPATIDEEEEEVVATVIDTEPAVPVVSVPNMSSKLNIVSEKVSTTSQSNKNNNKGYTAYSKDGQNTAKRAQMRKERSMAGKSDI